MPKKIKKKYYNKLTREKLSESSLDHIEGDMDPAHKNTFRMINAFIIFLFMAMTIVPNIQSVNAYSLVIVILIFMFFVTFSLEKRFGKNTPVHEYFRDTSMYFVISVSFFIVALVFLQVSSDMISLLLTYASALLGCGYGAIAFERTFHLGIK